MYSIDTTSILKEILKDLNKNNTQRYEKIMKKIDQIIQFPQHYKPLRYDLKGIRRVHIDSSFVLVFRIIEETKTVRFLDFDHHDKIYDKRFLE